MQRAHELKAYALIWGGLTDTLALGQRFPLSGLVRDLHPIAYAHAGRTKNFGGLSQVPQNPKVNTKDKSLLI